MRPETVSDGSVRPLDPLLSKQKEDVARMRASLLACSTDISNTSVALRNITVLRVFHQVSRIIRYLEMMDKIEDKLYESIDAALDKMDGDSPTAWMTLLNIQSRLQENMINSHKLLQPYLNIQEFSMMDMTISSSQEEISPGNVILSKESRDRLRTSAQQVLEALDIEESEES